MKDSKRTGGSEALPAAVTLGSFMPVTKKFISHSISTDSFGSNLSCTIGPYCLLVMLGVRSGKDMPWEALFDLHGALFLVLYGHHFAVRSKSFWFGGWTDAPSNGRLPGRNTDAFTG